MNNCLKTSYLRTLKNLPARKKQEVIEEDDIEIVINLAIHHAGIFPVSWLYAPTLEAVKDLLVEHGITEDDAKDSIRNDCAAFVIPLETDEELRCIVYITPDAKDRPRISDLCGLIAHEANHVVVESMKYISEKEPCGETLAYFQQYVTQTVLSDYLEFHDLKDQFNNG